MEVTRLPTTSRGSFGFGSTGVNALESSKQQKKAEMKFEHKEKAEEQAERHAYKLGKNLTIQQRQEIQNLLKEHEDVLAVSFAELGKAEVPFLHDIDTGDHPPIKQRPYRIPPAYRTWVQEEINRMLENGIIRKSKSPWASPITIVPKKSGDGSIVPRFCGLSKG